MDPPQEQIWQGAGEVMDPRQPLTRDQILRLEMSRLVGRLSRFRLILVPVGALFLTLVVLFDRQVWKMAALAGVVLLLGLVAFHDIRSLRGPRRSEPALYDLLVAIALQTALIWLTGAIESPLLVIYVPLALVAGLAAPAVRARLVLLGLVSGLLWLMTLSGLRGWVPRTVPSFLDLGPGYFDRATYALSKAAVVNLAMLIANHIGVGLRHIVHRMIDRALGAQGQVVELLGERNRELVQLSGAIAHELKNPLASVQGLVQLLERAGGRDQRERGRLKVLGREVDRMRTTLDEFLNFTRPLGELTLQTIDPVRLFQDLTAIHEGIAQAKDIEVRMPAGPAPALRADARKLSQALTNLLQNALEATPTGGRIEWLAEASGDMALIGLHDSGPGVPAAVLDRLSRGGATTKPEGSGIGLTVARAIAEQHGGQLLLENPPGGGCRALLRLPRQAPLLGPGRGAA